MPLVTFTVTRDASYSNYIDFNSQTGSPSFTMGPDAGTVQLDLPEGTTYTLSGRSDQSSTVLWTQLGNQVVGLEDGGDNDYNDLMVYVNAGEFNSVSGNQVTYTASAVSIFTFTASPTSINYGSGSTLSWTSGGGTNASINNGVGAVGLNDSTTVYPTVTTTYTLTISNSVGNSTTAQVTVNVSNPPPTINSFSASPLAIRRGVPTILSWQTTNATSVSISNGTTTTTGLAVDRTDYSVTPTTTTTYTLSVSGFVGGPITSSVTVTVYQPPVLTLELIRNPITVGQETTLTWSITGNADTLSWSSGGITNTLVTGIELVRPTTTTTYTATISGLGGSDTKSVTLLVYQIPTVSLSVPTSLLYGQQGTITYSSCYSNTSLVLTPTYSYSNASGGIVGTIVSLSRPNSAEIGVGTTCVNDQTTPTVIPYNTSGPRSVSYALTAVGSGGNKTVLGSTTIVIDETPDNINIPATDDVVKSQDPVYTPKATSTITLRVVDIDIPVEIKSDKPIKVEINDSNVFRDVRLM